MFSVTSLSFAPPLFAVAGSMSAPVADRNQGATDQARYREGVAESRKRAVEAELREELARTHADLASAAFALRTLREESLPAAESAFQAALEAFRQGVTDFIDVLDADRTRFQVERQLIDAQEAYHIAVAELEALLAQEL